MKMNHQVFGSVSFRFPPTLSSFFGGPEVIKCHFLMLSECSRFLWYTFHGQNVLLLRNQAASTLCAPGFKTNGYYMRVWGLSKLEGIIISVYMGTFTKERLQIVMAWCRHYRHTIGRCCVAAKIIDFLPVTAICVCCLSSGMCGVRQYCFATTSS